MKLARTILALLVLAIVPGCDWPWEDDPVAPPLPEPCDLVLNCTPISGAGDFYFCATNAPGAWTFSRNGLPQSIEFGGVAQAKAGDLVQACAAGCG